MGFKELLEEQTELEERFKASLTAINEKKKKTTLSKHDQKIVDLWMLGSTDDEKQLKGPVMNGEELAKEFGVSRKYIQTATSVGIMKLYEPLKKNLKMTPIETLIMVARVLGVEKDRDGLVTIYRALSKSAKKELLDQIGKAYPFLKDVAEEEKESKKLKTKKAEKTKK